MLAERFIVDDAGFEFHNEDASILQDTLLRFLDLLDYAQGTGAGIVTWSEMWMVQSASGRTLSELLYSTTDIERDVRLLVGGRLDKLVRWDDDISMSPPAEVQYEGSALPLAPGIAVAVVAHNQGHGMGCLTTDHAERRGPIRVTIEGYAATTVHFLVDSSDAPFYWRSIVDLEDLNEQGLAAISPFAFPQLRFCAGIWRQVGRFEGNYRDIRSLLIRDLSGLNDHALDVWRECVEPARISAEMAGRAGVNCSRESPQTHRNAAAMAERRVVFEEQNVTCEWHTKLEPIRNRIHFAVLDDYLIIGIFANHLST